MREREEGVPTGRTPRDDRFYFGDSATPHTAPEVFAGLTRMNSKIDEAAGASANNAGKMPRYTPKVTANVWTTYALTPEWTVGGGLTHVGKRYASEANTNYLPAYTTAALMVGYENRRHHVQLNVNNLFNKRYWDGAYGGHAVPGANRELTLSYGYKF